ncbi:MAG: CAP domain-containing protein [Solirubrobacteraceae bacterium]
MTRAARVAVRRALAAPALVAAALLAVAPALFGPAAALASRPAARAPHCAYANLRPTPTNAARVDSSTLCLLNQLRAAHHLRPLRSNRELRAVAAAQATGMVRHDYFGDTTPSGQTPGALIAALPYGAHAARLATGENLAWGIRSASTPANIVAAWMRSPPHRELILAGMYRNAGVGVSPAVPSILAHGQKGATYAVEFAARG